MKYSIRPAVNKDKESIIKLMKEHALFEGHNLQFSKQHEQLDNITELPVTIFVVDANNKLYGYMSVIKQFSTWDMDWYFYLDCLYLTEETRGQKIGHKLMQQLKVISKENKINTIQWQTPKENLSAIAFYKKFNTTNKEKARFFWGI